MADPALNTHGVKLIFGKHNGCFLTQIPVGYIRFMINNDTQQADLALAELKRRGSSLPVVELSGHAIDRASLRVWKIWRENRKQDEGLYSWLERITLEAIKDGKSLESGKTLYLGMKLVIEPGKEFPVLKSIMRK